MKTLWDRTSPLWLNGSLIGKKYMNIFKLDLLLVKVYLVL